MSVESVSILSLSTLVIICFASVALVKRISNHKRCSSLQYILQFLLLLCIFMNIVGIGSSLRLLYKSVDSAEFQDPHSLLIFISDSFLRSSFILALSVLLYGAEINQEVDLNMVRSICVYSVIRIILIMYLQLKFYSNLLLKNITTELLIASESLIIAIILIKILIRSDKNKKRIYSTYVSERFGVEQIIKKTYTLALYSLVCTICSIILCVINIAKYIFNDSPGMRIAANISLFLNIAYYMLIYTILIEVSFMRLRNCENTKKQVKNLTTQFFRYRLAEYVAMLVQDESSMASSNQDNNI